MFGEITDKVILSELSEMVTVGIANSATHAYVDNGVLMFRNQNIKANELDDSDLIYISAEFAKKYKNKTLKANDILVARTGYPGTACVVPEKYAGAQTFTTLIVRLKQMPELMPEFVCRYINSPDGQEYVKQNEAGSAQLNFGATALSKMPILLPPIELQRKYIELAQQTDKSKFEIKKAIEKTSALIKSLMQQNLSN
jgi:type I restriction enzyme S subunit